MEYLGSIPLELAKCTEDDHSNYDSAVEHIDHDKSCGSSVTAESEYSSSKDFNSRKDKNVLSSLIDGSSQKQENKDITNGNNCFEGCDQIVDSLNKLNIGFNRELYRLVILIYKSLFHIFQIKSYFCHCYNFF